MTTVMKIFAPILLAFAAQISFAGTIDQPQGGLWLNLNFYGPMGQTFTADDSALSSVEIMLENAGPATPLTYTLRAGSGVGGEVLASRTFTLPGAFRGLAQANFGDAPLNIGATYTLMVSTSGNGWLADFNNNHLPGAVDYPGGVAVIHGQLNPELDMTFQIETVPEPSCWGLGIFGMAVVLLGRAGMNRRTTNLEPLADS